MRTLHITPSVRLLGARRSLLTLVSGLRELGVEPLVLVPSEGGLTHELDARGVRWKVLRLSPWRKGFSWLSIPRQLAELRQLLAREPIDLVHCNEIYPNPHALAACAAARPLFSAMRQLWGRTPGQLTLPVVTHMRLSVTPRMIRNYGLGSATRVIAVSEGAAKDFDRVQWKAERVRVVHNGIEFPEFEAAGRARDITREKFGFSASDFIVGQIGLLMPRKRPRFVLESAVTILERVPNAKFLFIGEASPGHQDYLDQLKAFVQDRGLTSSVRFLPFQTDVAQFFGMLDLNLLLSDDEGFGRVVIEAAAAGVPSIGSNVGGIPELIADGETGYLIGESHQDDGEFWGEMPAFIERVCTLATNPQMTRALGSAAHDRACARFSSDVYVRSTLRVFEEALVELSRPGHVAHSA